MPSFWLVIYSIIGGIFLILVNASVKKRRLYLTVSKLFQYGRTVNQNEIIVELTVFNRGWLLEDEIEITLSRNFEYELIATTDNDIDLKKDKILIKRFPNNHSITIIIKVYNNDFSRDNIAKFTSNHASGQVVSGLSNMTSTGEGLFGIGFLATITIMAFVFFNPIQTSTQDNNSYSGAFKDKQFLDVAKKSGCLACHAATRKVVGPSWNDIFARYNGKEDASKELIQKVKVGGKGNWTKVTGGVPMPPYSPRVSDKNIAFLVNSILNINEE